MARYIEMDEVKEGFNCSGYRQIKEGLLNSKFVWLSLL